MKIVLDAVKGRPEVTIGDLIGHQAIEEGYRKGELLPVVEINTLEELEDVLKELATFDVNSMWDWRPRYSIIVTCPKDGKDIFEFRVHNGYI